MGYPKYVYSFDFLRNAHDRIIQGMIHDVLMKKIQIKFDRKIFMRDAMLLLCHIN